MTKITENEIELFTIKLLATQTVLKQAEMIAEELNN
jgi:hypothetical protein